MAGTKVQFKITKTCKFTCPEEECSPDTEHLFKPAYSTGQIIFVEDAGQIFLDFHNWRRCYSTSNDDRKYGVRYLGISASDPTKGTIEIGGVAVTPKINDMVAFESKEYIYRNGEDGKPTWYEVGDEESPAWNVEDED